VRLIKYLSQGVGHPAVARRPVMDVIGIAISKEARQFAATAVRKEALLFLKIPANHIGECHYGAFFEFHYFGKL
jgi:hypothetical protein